MPVNGRNKGASFERTVAKLFSEALGIKLRRTPMSGGWSHGNPDTAGDLVCVEGEFSYCVECKCSEGWHLETLFSDSHKWFDAWWNQLIRECPEHKTPLLAFSRARQPVFVAMKSDILMLRGLSVHTIMYVNMEDTTVAIFLLEDLLTHLKQ